MIINLLTFIDNIVMTLCLKIFDFLIHDRPEYAKQRQRWGCLSLNSNNKMLAKSIKCQDWSYSPFFNSLIQSPVLFVLPSSIFHLLIHVLSCYSIELFWRFWIRLKLASRHFVQWMRRINTELLNSASLPDHQMLINFKHISVSTRVLVELEYRLALRYN